MSGKYFQGRVEFNSVEKYHQKELDEVQLSIDKLEPMFFELQLHRYLEELWKPLSVANRTIDRCKPWNMMKEGREEEAMALNGLIAIILAKVTILLHPVMPRTTKKIADILGFEINTENFEKVVKRGELLKPFKTEKREALFPRIERELLEEKKDKPKDIDEAMG